MNHNIFKQETIIYGGAFNPPTRAHQSILQACVDYAEPRNADVWVLPSGTRTDKLITVSRETRLAYIRTMANDVVARTVRIGIEEMELDRPVPTETHETVEQMSNKYPDRSFTWVFGSDSLETMPEWTDGERLFSELTMLVVERPKHPIVCLGSNVTRLEVEMIETSSTDVKERLRHNLPIGDIVTPAIERLLVPSGN